MRRATSLVRGVLLVLWLPTLVVTAWWVLPSSTSLYLPRLSVVLDALHRDWLFARVGSDLLPSLRNLILGFALSAVLGIVGGVVLGRIRWVRLAAEPYIHFMRSIPPPVLIPFALVLLGVGVSMKVGVIVIAAVWPTLINTMDGVRGVSGELTSMSAIYRLTLMQRLRYVVLPAAAPQVMAGLRTTLQVSVILIVVSEMVASTGGIGYYVLLSQQTFAIPETWAGTVILGVIGYACAGLFGLAEKKILHWHIGMRQAAMGA